MLEAPFPQNLELCKSLNSRDGFCFIQRSKKCHADSDRRNYLPGEPRIPLDEETIGTHLKEELLTEDLDRLSPRLWLVATQDSAHISSLTHQVVRGRDIVITEKPELHLIWHYNRVFIKPMPKYLLSYTFWNFYLTSPLSPIKEPLQSTLRKAALGFLRSYSYLIQHRSDFNLAMRDDKSLLPKGTKFSRFARLINSLDIDDDAVSARYHYGELRLSRLNFWVKVFRFRFTYHKVEGQYGPYFARFYGPILFLFGLLSVVLSGMQVVLAAMSLDHGSSSSWQKFTVMSRGFSVFTLTIILAIICFFLLTFVALALREIMFALKDKHLKRRARTQIHIGIE